MDNDKVTRAHLVSLIKGGNAHMTLDDAVKEFPPAQINAKFPKGTYSSWGLLEHIRLSQMDIMEFIKNPAYKDKEWPKDYWPSSSKKATKKDWDNTVAMIKKDSKELERIATNPKTDIYAKIPHGTGQTVLREILLVADHNSYHIGELAIMRQVMGTWSKNHDKD